MSANAIEIRGIGKRYDIAARQKERHNTLRDMIAAAARSPLRALRRPASETFWALGDVSFDVAHGEAVAVIGHNGAGKSTLLKILSRITDPTTGYAEIDGRLGSLLEVGTGFHPELSGRENVFLNGAILGMSRGEIRKRFDAIVSFAEVEAFVDTPVKRYSSGMYLRLAFAVAAHLDPEILLIDEVLAVGDAAFQRKCLGRMQDVTERGRTVVFVSHNMAAVRRLCSRGVLLDHGRMKAAGSIEDVLEQYVADIEDRASADLADRPGRKGDGRVRFVDFWLENGGGERAAAAVVGETADLVMEYDARPGAAFLHGIRVVVWVTDALGQRLLMLSTDFTGDAVSVREGRGRWRCRIPSMPLVPGRYSIELFCGTSTEPADHVMHAATLDVTDGDFFGTGRLPAHQRKSVFLVDHAWSDGAMAPAHVAAAR